ncbi:hypothetical protein AB0J82_36610 [Asanoa sp. NPDC049518]|uniref:hypothetical protein n=1 Tax=unclassified Asanoa TaxID=2685164 RepID=UPI00343780FB
MTAHDITDTPPQDVAPGHDPDIPLTDIDPGADTDAGRWPTSPFACVDTAFAALTNGPNPLAVDGDRFDKRLGLPTGQVTLPVLREWLTAHPGLPAARDAVWRDLIGRARLDGPAWVIAATAFALPALVGIAAELTRAGWTGDPDDVDAEVLAGFLSALRDRVDVTGPAPHRALCRAAWRAGLALVRQQRRFMTVDDVEAVASLPSHTPRPPWGHPDLLIRRAVVLGLIDACDEQPYIDVRLGHRAIEPIAARLGLAPDTLRRRLTRIDTRLAIALADGMLTGAPSPQARAELAAQARRRTHIRGARRRRAAPSCSHG